MPTWTKAQILLNASSQRSAQKTMNQSSLLVSPGSVYFIKMYQII